MGNVMKLDDILESINGTTEKVASDNSTSGATNKETTVNKAKEDLMNTLSKGHEKFASHANNSTPEGSMEKIAQQVIENEEEALIKQANLYGASVCDGFMQRLGMYKEASAQLPEDFAREFVGGNQSIPHINDFQKVASSHYHDDDNNVYRREEIEEAIYSQGEDDIEKFAHDSFPGVEFSAFDLETTDELIKEAAQHGIHLTDEEAIEKVASDAFDVGYNEIMETSVMAMAHEGYNDTMEKAASLTRLEGYMDTMEKCAEYLVEAGEMDAARELEKTAFEVGYNDAMEKFAGSAFEQGFSDMQEVINNYYS